LFLHGGPGLGFTDQDKRFFDPAIFHVILFDQRGSGRSKPLGSIEHNTTDKLVDDITELLDHLEVEKVILFGGSWGSTLALVYGIRHPHRVTGMVLRGIFPGTETSIRHFTNGGVAPYFPEAWQRFREMVPAEKRGDAAGFYFEMMQSPDEQIRKKYAYEWALFGGSLSKMGLDPGEISEKLEYADFESNSLLEAYYSIHHCFLPDNYIYENADKLGEIPVRIVHGRYDMICPPVFAIELHEPLRNSKLSIVQAGHAASEPAIEEKLKSELKELATMI
jgi:proline iminopeptidase